MNTESNPGLASDQLHPWWHTRKVRRYSRFDGGFQVLPQYAVSTERGYQTACPEVV